MKNLKELIKNAEEKKSEAFSKYQNNQNLSGAMEYYMDLSNAFNELLDELKIIEINK